MITRDRGILESGLTGRLLQGCLNEHLAEVREMDKLREAYLLQAPSRRPRGEGLPDHQIRHAYPRYIVTMAASYLAGAAVSYQGEGAEPLSQALAACNAAGVDLELARQCSLYGKGVEVIYADEAARPCTAVLDPRCAFVVYSTDACNLPLFGVHYHPLQDEDGVPAGYEAQVYTARERFVYRGRDLSTLMLSGPKGSAVHYFGHVPLIEYWNNGEERGDVADVLPLIEAYDALQSCRLNDQEQLSDALLIVYGARLETDERGRTPAQQLRQDKLLYLPDREAGAQYLVKQGSQGAEEMRSALERDIHKFSLIPDLSDEQFSGNVSGVAMKYKLLGLEQLAKGKERWFREGLRERLRCFAHFLSVKGLKVPDADEIRLIFTRSLPENALEAAQMVKTLEGMAPTPLLLSQLPFLDGQTIPEMKEEE